METGIELKAMLWALLSSYRTYEEWKPVKAPTSPQENFCSYRTYEEWKQYCSNISSALTFFVLTVPMRNGNAGWLGVHIPEMEVLTVPMRNGNFEGTDAPHPVSSARSYRTYEEWKLPSPLFALIQLAVLTVPMRNGNEVSQI